MKYRNIDPELKGIAKRTPYNRVREYPSAHSPCLDKNALGHFRPEYYGPRA